jgi:hypothetical protein
VERFLDRMGRGGGGFGVGVGIGVERRNTSCRFICVNVLELREAPGFAGGMIKHPGK